MDVEQVWVERGGKGMGRNGSYDDDDEDGCARAVSGGRSDILTVTLSFTSSSTSLVLVSMRK